VTVEDAGGNPVDGASVNVQDTATNNLPFTEHRNFEILETSGSDGTVIIGYVLEGPFEIHARLGDLTGETSGSIAADEVLPVTVSLEPVGAIQGTVYEPDGVTPVQEIVEVGLYGGVRAQYSITDENGIFVFENIPLYDNSENPRHYMLDVYAGGEVDPGGNYIGGRLRARVEDLVLETNGQVITQDLTLIGIGTVSGRVIMPDSSGASGLQVTLESHTPVFGRIYSAITNAFGEYTFENISVGDFTATSGDPDLQLLGETEGTITDHLDVVTADIILQTNAITLPQDLYDGNIFRYDLQSDGTIRYGKSLFNYNARGGCSLDIISQGTAHTFPDAGVATQENSGREIVVKKTDLGGINVTRKIYVPEDAYFARYLEILSNASSTDVTVDLRISSDFYDYYISYYSPHETAAIATTSSGDDQIQVGVESPDLWVTVDDNKPEDPFVNTYNNIAPSAFVWAGLDAVANPDTAALSPYETATSTPANLAVQWSSVTVPAGESVAFMHFVVPHASREAAQACAERLVQIPPEALSGLSLAEMAIVKNFSLPADGGSSLEPLPPLTGEVTGHVLAGDGVTSAGSTTVYFNSDNIYFSRTYTDGTYSDGAFDFITDDSNSSYGRRIPIDGFTLWARASVSSGSSYRVNPDVDSPVVSEDFAPGSTTNSVDIVFSNTGILRGVVRQSTGDPVANALVYAKSDSFWSYQYNTAADGTYVLPILLPDDYVVEVSTKTHPQGDPIETEAAAAIAAGHSVTLNIFLPPLGAVSGIVYDHEGLPVEGALVRISDGKGFDRTTHSDSDGSYTLTDLPEGDYTLWTYDPVSDAPTTSSVSVTEGVTTPVDVMLPYSASLPMDLYDGNGFRWDIQTDGRIRYGTDNAYYYSSYGGLDLYRITLPDGYYDDFNAYSTALAEDEGRELTVGPHVFSGRDLEVSRKIFVPDDEAFARYLEILENTGAGDMTVRIYVRTYLGSRGDTEIIHTSSGDQSLAADDDYIITDDEDGAGTPTMVHVFSGPNAEVEPSEMESYLSSYYYRMGYYFDVTIPAGERRIVMHFASQNSSRADAHAGAAALHCLQGRALAGLSPDEQMDIVNFVAFADSDCDGLIDEEEDSLGTDPNNPDTDGDGLTDRFEVDHGFDPLLPEEGTGDPDNDGLDNLGEQAAGTDPHNPDSDGDGISDGDEVNVYGTDPTSAVIRITDGAVPSDQADMAIDSLGNIHVVWVDDRHDDGDSNDEIYYTLLNSGGGTLIDHTRITTDVSRSRRPAIAVDTRNRAHIAWQDKRLNNTPEIFYTLVDPSAHPQDGSPGDDAVLAVVDDYLLSADDGEKGDTPRLTVDSQDRVHLVWSETDLGEIQYARLEVDETTSAVSVISRAIFSAGQYRWYPAHTDIGLDSEENVHVIWLDHRDTSAVEIYYKMLDRATGATLIDETVLTADDGYDAQYPSIGVGPDDAITVVFSDYRVGTNEGYMMRIDPSLDDQDGSAAQLSDVLILPETRITPDDGVDSGIPTGTVDAQGNTRVTYFDTWESWYSYPAELHLLVTDSNGDAIEDAALTPDTSAVTNGTDWTRARPATSGITSYVVWTDDRFGNTEVLLQIINPDRDKDGLVDATELLSGTDPDDPDSDNDGLLDGFEVMYGFNPLSDPGAGEANQDPDEDGLTNLEEQLYGTDPRNADMDGDGLLDGEEVNTYGTDPLRADTDGDGLTDYEEVRVYGTDPFKADTDNDGLSDSIEIQYGLDPNDGTDADADFDGDGLSNAMEIALGTDLNLADTDGDDLLDEGEVNLHGTDPLNPDTDGDGLLDGVEVNTYGTDPLNPDTDNDGLSDGDEVNIYGTDPLEFDTDGGGRTDGEEVLKDGTDPTNGSDDEIFVLLTQGTGIAEAPSAAVDSQGNIHLVWADDREGNKEIFYAMLSTAGSILIDATQLSNGSLAAGRPVIALDSQDRVHAAWQDEEYAGEWRMPTKIFHTMIDPARDDQDGSTGSDAAMVLVDDQIVSTYDSLNLIRVSHPHLAADGQSYVHVAWSALPEQDVGGWIAPVLSIHHAVIGSDGQIAVGDDGVYQGVVERWEPGLPKVAVDSLNRAHLVWEDLDAGYVSRVFYLMLDSEGVMLIGATPLSSETAESMYPSVDALFGGEVVVLFESRENWEEPYISMMTLDPSQVAHDGAPADPSALITLGPTAVATGVGSASMVPSAVTDESGRVHLAWYGGDNEWSGRELLFKVLDQDGTTVVEERFVTESPTARSRTADTGDILLPALAVSSQGSYAVWTDVDPEGPGGLSDVMMRILHPIKP